MNNLIRLVYVSFAFILISCGSAPKGTGPVFQLDSSEDGKSKVYHYRLDKIAGNGLYYYLYMDNKFISQIGNGGYFIQDLAPGKYKYSVKNQVTAIPFMLPTHITSEIDNKRAKIKEIMTINVESGRSYYFRWNYGFGKVESVDEKTALKELNGMRQFESTDIKNK